MKLGQMAGLIATAGGIVGIPVIIYSFPESREWTKVSIVSIVILLLVSIFVGPIQKLFLPKSFRRHGIVPNRNRFRISRKREIVDIRDNYCAKISTEKDFFFLERPHASDLVDVIEVLYGESITESDYESSNSNVSYVKNRKDSVVAIYWEPKSEIFQNRLYRHNSSYEAKNQSAYGPGYFWQGYIVDALTGQCDWIFNCPEPVASAYAFTLPLFGNSFDLENLWKLGQVLKRRDCIQPKISKDRKKVTWDLKNPKNGTSYVCIVIYEGGHKIFENEALIKIAKKFSFLFRLLKLR